MNKLDKMKRAIELLESMKPHIDIMQKHMNNGDFHLANEEVVRLQVIHEEYRELFKDDIK
jgi:hypothetical protein